MRACPGCGRLYPDDAGFCPVDGFELVSATQAPIAANPDDGRVGQMLCERYQIRRVVADGGMGRVYEALDLRDGGNVAVKVLHPDVSRDEVAVARFRREFEVSQLLPHDYIVEVRDFQATHDGSYAIAMEFLYGEELRACVKREGIISAARTVRMISQVAMGLDGAHARKLVHRDLKPDNIFLCQKTDGDHVKILDFGSVKDKADNAKKLTVMGTTIGSPFYMAPEQAQGLDTLDHRADVWALAAITYECITGSVPFQGNNGPSILLEILTKEPTPPSVAAKDSKHPVPPSVDAVMTRAFKKNAGMRIASVGNLADSFGRAYGLDGSHTDWAVIPELDLAKQIEAELPRMMTAEVPTGPSDNAADAFFDELDSLGNAPDPMAQAMNVPPPAPPPQIGGAPAAAPAAYDDVPLTVPSHVPAAGPNRPSASILDVRVTSRENS